MTTSTHDLVAPLVPFAATELSIVACTPAGRAFLARVAGPGAVSVTLPKSRAPELAAAAEAAGLTVGA